MSKLEISAEQACIEVQAILERNKRRLALSEAVRLSDQNPQYPPTNQQHLVAYIPQGNYNKQFLIT